jgi:Ca-activated chloride channel family protein
MVPLKSINYNLEIVNSLVHVTLVQEYENPSNRYLNVYYSFPIRPESSLYKFEAKFGNVTVEGVVKEKEKAQAEFEKAKI